MSASSPTIQRAVRNFAPARAGFFPLLLFFSWISYSNEAPTPPVDNMPARLPRVLSSWVPSYPESTMEALSALKRGIENYQRDQYAASLKELDGIGPEATGLADYVFLYRARAKMMLDRTEEALEDFRLLERRPPDSSVNAREVCLGECRALLKLRRPAEALAALQNGRLEQDSEVLNLRASALEALGKPAEAVPLYLQVYTGDVKSSHASTAEQRLQGISPQTIIAQKNRGRLLTRVENLLRAERYREARALLLKLGRYPSSDKLVAEKQHLLLGETEYHLDRVLAALTHLKRVTSPELQPEALYYEASCQRRRDAEAPFLELRDRALKLYPHSAFTERLLYSVATYYDVKNESDAAYPAYQAISEGFAQGEYAQRSWWKLSFYDYFSGNYEKALQGFWKYAQTYPDPRGAAGAFFWMGHCYAKLGDAASAAQLYRRVAAAANYGYYAQSARAAEAALGNSSAGRPSTAVDLKQILAGLDKSRGSKSSIPEPADAVLRVIERARRLTAAGLHELALSELRRAMRYYPQERALNYVVARICAGQGNYQEAITALRRAFPDYDALSAESLPPEVWELLFPLPHAEIVASEAEKHGVDPYLVFGLIRQESAFNAEARSPANARGLMQLLPSTGRILAPREGIHPFSAARLFQARINIALGTRYLASLLERFGNREVLALAAYNAGDKRVQRWIEQFGDNDLSEFVERIPFSETRAYIKQVLTNRALYGILSTPSSMR